MEYLLQGILIGLGLNVLLGPIFVIITQTAIDKGVKPGLFLTSGIWISDAIMAFFCLMFLQRITPYTSNPNFKLYLGIIGGFLLIFIGLKMIYDNNKKQLDKPVQKVKAFYYLTYTIKGFLINTLNPFTVFFWIGVFSTIVFGGNANNQETTLLMVGIFSIIISTDVLKVFLAKRIRKYMNKERMFLLNKYAGIVFIGLGFILMIRSAI